MKSPPPNTPKEDNKASKFFKISPTKFEEPSEINIDDEKKNSKEKRLNEIEKTVNNINISSTDYTDQPPMDLSKDVYPSPDQDSNRCLDGESNEIKNDQIQLNCENDTTTININLEESLAEAETSELRNDESEIEDIEAKNNEANDTINLTNDDTLECNGFVTIVESNEKEKEDYKNLLKSESPSLENFLNDYNLELSVN